MIRLYLDAVRQLLADVASVLGRGRHRAGVQSDSLTAHGYSDHFEAAWYACFDARHKALR